MEIITNYGSILDPEDNEKASDDSSYWKKSLQTRSAKFLGSMHTLGRVFVGIIAR